MGVDKTSSAQGATPVTDTGAMPTASAGAMPAKPEPATLEEARARIAELERHAANKEEQATRHGKNLSSLEKQLAAYQEKERLAEEAKLSEAEKTNKRLAEITEQAARYQKELISAKVQLAARSLGIIDPEMAALAISQTLEYGPDGMPTNTDAALAELIKNKPYLVGAKAQDADADTTPAQTSTPQRSPSVIPAMNPEGRSVIRPGSPTPGGKPVIPSWDDVYKATKKR